MNHSIPQNLAQIRQLITQTEKESQRMPGSVLLVAVSKQQTLAAMREAYALGLRDFGESYVQEAVGKIQNFESMPITWHFIGRVQGNKAKIIAQNFDWIHGLDSLRSAQALSQHRPRELKRLNLCLQINCTGEKTKAGIDPERAVELALQVSQLPGLQLRGLMTILPFQDKPSEQYRYFCQLAELNNKLAKQVQGNWDTLSMGMSNDMVQAIRAGSTLLRIGRGIFGARS